MLKALLPLRGIYLRILLQDLEQDNASGEQISTILPAAESMEKNDIKNGDTTITCPAGCISKEELFGIARHTADRALVSAKRVEDEDHCPREEEIVLLCLRTLLLLLYRYSCLR
jgi:hypothetical protein